MAPVHSLGCWKMHDICVSKCGLSFLSIFYFVSLYLFIPDVCFGWMSSPAQQSLDVAMHFNDAALDMCVTQGKGRMSALCQVPLQDLDLACAEVSRATKNGCVGVQIGIWTTSPTLCLETSWNYCCFLIFIPWLPCFCRIISYKLLCGTSYDTTTNKTQNKTKKATTTGLWIWTMACSLISWPTVPKKMSQFLFIHGSDFVPVILYPWCCSCFLFGTDDAQ